MLVLYCLCFILAMLLHELGHLCAARVCRVPARELGLGWGACIYQVRIGSVWYKLHALPVGAYVRLDMNELQRRPLDQQVFVLLAGIIVNVIAASVTRGTPFSLMNLLLAMTNRSIAHNARRLDRSRWLRAARGAQSRQARPAQDRRWRSLRRTDSRRAVV